MKLVAVIAENANAALAQIHERLGPEAVVVSVRKIQPEGLARLWQNNRKIEITACLLPETPQPKTEIPVETKSAMIPFGKNFAVETTGEKSSFGRWRSVAWLESKGLLPAFTEQLEQKVFVLHGEKPPATPETEWSAVTDLIVCHWRPARSTMTGTGRPHVFIGPAGSGKTTALCKWMTSAVLVNEQRVQVFRLDGESANVSELLALHCELLGVSLDRFWNETATADLRFVDLPGVEIHNANGMAALRDQISALPEPHIHLVLNAAYESSILFEQFHAFEAFAPEDIIFTHLDEERRRVKLWNFVLGTNCPISFLGAGQKIPGEFRRAEPALLFPQKNCR
jgi:flagellar biosynthesis protein FlhF